MIIMAIDPGLKGGVAVTTDWQVFETWPMPIRYFRYGSDPRRRGKKVNHVDVTTLHWLALMSHVDAIVVEQQTSMPRQSSVSTGTCFANYGLVLSLRLVAPLHVVHPLTWKKALKVPADKKRATERCRELMGTAAPEQDGPAEALLLAHYWRTLGIADAVTGQAELRRLGAVGKAKAVRGGLQPGAQGAGSADGAVAAARPR